MRLRNLKSKAASNAARHDVRPLVLIQCAGATCLGYQDAAGQWRGFFTQRKLPSPVHVVEGLIPGFDI